MDAWQIYKERRLIGINDHLCSRQTFGLGFERYPSRLARGLDDDLRPAIECLSFVALVGLHAREVSVVHADDCPGAFDTETNLVRGGGNEYPLLVGYLHLDVTEVAAIGANLSPIRDQTKLRGLAGGLQTMCGFHFALFDAAGFDASGFIGDRPRDHLVGKIRKLLDAHGLAVDQ